jgi:hypothetical protein
MLTMTQRVRPAAAASVPQAEHVLRGKLHLVDLAGSERSKETGTTGVWAFAFLLSAVLGPATARMSAESA